LFAKFSTCIILIMVLAMLQSFWNDVSSRFIRGSHWAQAWLAGEKAVIVSFFS